MSTTIFEGGDIVVAPFPHLERGVVVARPAVIVSRHAIGPDGLLLWVAMITNADHPAWPGDISIPNAEEHSLLIPSKIRTAKIATVERGSTRRLGRLEERVWSDVRDALRHHLGL